MRRLFAILCLTAATACGDPTGSADARVSLAIVGSDIMYAAAGVAMPEPLQITAIDPVTKEPVKDVEIEWRVIQGTVAVTPATSKTDQYGVAAATATPGPVGTYRVRAQSSRMVGDGPTFEIRVVPPPVLADIAPASITAGDTAVITGQNFSTIADHNVVLFDGVRGRVVTATATQLRVVVPSCLPARQVTVRVGLGFVFSEPRIATAAATAGTILSLLPGQSRTFSDPADLACIRLPGELNALYLFTPHNVGEVLTAPLRFELRGLAAAAPVTTVIDVPQAARAFASDWELALRAHERELRGDVFLPAIVAAAEEPKIGDRREFNVIDRENHFQKTTGTVRVISQRAVVYVDNEASSVLTDAELVNFATLFDDPIYQTDVDVFGAPSDIDANGRILILFTQRVNQLTPRNEGSFIAGYFYGCDLLPKARCSGTNRAEVFYSLVPDPTGKWGDPRTLAQIRLAVPPVLAHEFQHMIHFARRNFSTDALWLSEGLAHSAEEIVGDVIAPRDPSLGALFRNSNHARAQRYLAATESTSLIAGDASGTIELRGGAWLFLKYLRGHYGENTLLNQLTNSTRSGIGNLTSVTGQPWSTMLTNFGVALWADRAPELRGTLETRHRFVNFNLRGVIGGMAGGFPLFPTTVAWRDFSFAGSLPTASQDYLLLAAPTTGSVPALNFVFSGPRGAPLGSNAHAMLTILRVR